MSSKRWLAGLALVALGALAGAAGFIISTEVLRRSATDAFCTSCHSMTAVAADPRYKQSGHENNSAGLRAGCADCHIPPGSWLEIATADTRLAVKDVFAEYTHNFADPTLWEERRKQLTTSVVDDMRRSDSVTCRKCHDASAIRPRSDAGRTAHATLAQGGATCIDCHVNLVHAP